jgi:hypothetical protein
MMGGDLPGSDDFTLNLLTNPEVLLVDQNSTNNRELFVRGDQIAWTADVPGSSDKYLAVFNVSDNTPADVTVTWKELGLRELCVVRDLWDRKEVGDLRNEIKVTLNPHGSRLFRISPVFSSNSN